MGLPPGPAASIYVGNISILVEILKGSSPVRVAHGIYRLKLCVALASAG